MSVVWLLGCLGLFRVVVVFVWLFGCAFPLQIVPWPVQVQHEVPDKMLVHTLELLFRRIGLLPSRFFDLSRKQNTGENGSATMNLTTTWCAVKKQADENNMCVKSEQ